MMQQTSARLSRARFIETSITNQSASVSADLTTNGKAKWTEQPGL
jgi:hypothetical protein